MYRGAADIDIARSVAARMLERVWLSEQWCEHTLDSSEQSLRFLEALRSVFDLFVLLRQLRAHIGKEESSSA